MPKGGRLRADETDALAQWVNAGARWPAASAAATTAAAAPAGPGSPAPVAAPSPASYTITPEQRAFWSFRPLHTPAVPSVAHMSWPKTDIDRFVLARLEREGMAPVASRRQAHADPAGHSRSHRAAADSRRDRCLPTR